MPSIETTHREGRHGGAIERLMVSKIVLACMLMVLGLTSELPSFVKFWVCCLAILIAVSETQAAESLRPPPDPSSIMPSPPSSQYRGNAGDQSQPDSPDTGCSDLGNADLDAAQLAEKLLRVLRESAATKVDSEETLADSAKVSLCVEVALKVLVQSLELRGLVIKAPDVGADGISAAENAISAETENKQALQESQGMNRGSVDFPEPDFFGNGPLLPKYSHRLAADDFIPDVVKREIKWEKSTDASRIGEEVSSLSSTSDHAVQSTRDTSVQTDDVDDVDLDFWAAQSHGRVVDVVKHELTNKNEQPNLSSKLEDTHSSVSAPKKVHENTDEASQHARDLEETRRMTDVQRQDFADLKAAVIVRLPAAFREDQRLGAGATASVFRYVNPEDGRVCAAKFLDFKRICKLNIWESAAAWLHRAEKSREKFKEEVEVTELLSAEGHPNIVKFIGWHGPDLRKERFGQQWIVIEKAEFALSQEGVRITQRIDCLSALRDMMSALEQLESWEVLHRDIKPANVLCFGCDTAEPESVPNLPQERNVLKLADFGCSQLIGKENKGLYGTFDYLAPETFMRTEYSYKSDLYSCYVTWLEVRDLICVDRRGTEDRRIMRRWDVISEAYKKDREFADQFRDMGLWNPDDRPTATRVKERIDGILARDAALKHEISAKLGRQKFDCINKARVTSILKRALDAKQRYGA